MPARQTCATFIARANEVHAGRYTYEQAVYQGTPVKLVITCPAHGSFEQSPNSHLAGHGCPTCGADAKGTGVQPRRKTTEQFIAQGRQTHGDRYDYTLVVYTNAKSKVQVRCREHGVFEQRPDHHLQGAGCLKCRDSRPMRSQETFLAQARAAHGNRYDYSLAVFTGIDAKLQVLCPVHGKFHQEADHHLRGQGCPSCSNRISKPEKDLLAFVQSLVPEATGDFKIGKYQYDIRVGKTLIEYHGLYWHSTAVMTQAQARRKHETKRVLAESHGLRYVAIYEDEWRNTQERTKAYLTALLGHAPTAGARMFEVQEVTGKQARAFYLQHHLLGAGALTGRHMALTEAGVVAACMTVGPSTERRGTTQAWSLSRFATDGRAIAGAASRLLRAFGPLPELVSYVDLDKFTGAVYARLGFEPDAYLPPDYWTIQDGVRRHKTATQLKHLRQKQGFDPALSEFENCQKLGFFQVYHSGRRRVVRQPTGC